MIAGALEQRVHPVERIVHAAAPVVGRLRPFVNHGSGEFQVGGNLLGCFLFKHLAEQFVGFHGATMRNCRRLGKREAQFRFSWEIVSACQRGIRFDGRHETVGGAPSELCRRTRTAHRSERRLAAGFARPFRQNGGKEATECDDRELISRSQTGAPGGRAFRSERGALLCESLSATNASSWRHAGRAVSRQEHAERMLCAPEWADAPFCLTACHAGGFGALIMLRNQHRAGL